MTTVVIPALNYTVNATESTLYSLAFMRPAISWLEGVIRGPILPVVQPVFNSSLLIAGLFFGILALNLLADRFWCRYLCPLGGVAGLVVKILHPAPIDRPDLYRLHPLCAFVQTRGDQDHPRHGRIFP